MTATLAQRIEHASIGFDELEKTYGPMLGLVEQLIGVVPKCDNYLEIWSPGFRTYNLVVPNLLGLPASLFGRGAPKDMVGLGMYVSSRAAGCGYCSAHTCSFALRRGASKEAVTGAERSGPETAVADLADAIGTVPHTVTSAKVAALASHYSASDVEGIVQGMVLMGFLNKFMDALGIELEVESLNDVATLIEPTGWSAGQHNWHDPSYDKAAPPPPKDSLSTYLKVIRHGPFANRLENRWLSDVPKDPAQARSWLTTATGYDEPLLESFSSPALPRAMAGVMRENLDPERSEIGIPEKAVVARRFASFLGNEHLVARADDFLATKGIDPQVVADEGGERWAAIERLADAFSPSPASVDESTASRAIEFLQPAEIVELAVWQSVLQMWHRWELFVAHRPG